MSTQQLEVSRSCSCGRRLVNLSSRPVESVCMCGLPYALAANPDSGATVSDKVEWGNPTCHHRGPQEGTASCGCGLVYRCELLGKFCADRPLAFELYTINVINPDGTPGQVLSRDYQSDSRAVSDAFQACSECEHFTAPPTPQPPAPPA